MSDLLHTARLQCTAAERPPLRLLPATETLPHDGDHRDRDDLRRSAERRARFRGGLAGGVFGRVRAYVDAHLGEHITLDDLARQAGVSRFHFARQFRLSTGESPMAYLRRARVERALRLLLSRDATIAGVAARLGFADQSHFTRTFARLVGISPGRFILRADWSSNDGAA
jgi:AraC-like DNA-binding protein